MQAKFERCAHDPDLFPHDMTDAQDPELMPHDLMELADGGGNIIPEPPKSSCLYRHPWH